ncbi:phosphate ABC transporter permease subunit PstC [Paenibacillus sp. JSM ZJ436]
MNKELSGEHPFRSNKPRSIEYAMPVLLFLCALVSIFTTIGIVYTLVTESVAFFKEVNVFKFLSGTTWAPLIQPVSFGVIPLLFGTLLVTLIACCIALPVGLATAIYLSEYASPKVAKIVKPVLEVLAGVPTIVYGYFALSFITPVLQTLLPGTSLFNALSAGIAVGIMIIPMVSSLSEDAMKAVPKSLRHGAYALGATRFEVAIQVVLPAALSGIISSFVLAFSRAIGETMIVTVAAGATPQLTASPLESIQTMTAYIVQVSLGDTPHGSLAYGSIFAVGLTLFVITLLLNIVAAAVSKRFREVY